MPGPTPDSMHDRKLVDIVIEKVIDQLTEFRGVLCEGTAQDVYAHAAAFSRMTHALTPQIGIAVSGIAHEEYGDFDSWFESYSYDKTQEIFDRWVDAQNGAIDSRQS